jgi:hypothetical protein
VDQGLVLDDGKMIDSVRNFIGAGRHQNDGRAVIVLKQFGQVLQESGAGFCVQTAAGVVENEEIRFLHECACDQYLSSFTGGQMQYFAVEQVFNTEQSCGSMSSLSVQRFIDLLGIHLVW